MIGDSCLCIDHDLRPEFSVEQIVTARKQHECGECGAVIKPGERYERSSGKWDGDFYMFKTCLTCRNVRDSLMPCGWIYGEVWSSICDWLEGEGVDTKDENGESWLL